MRWVLWFHVASTFRRRLVSQATQEYRQRCVSFFLRADFRRRQSIDHCRLIGHFYRLLTNRCPTYEGVVYQDGLRVVQVRRQDGQVAAVRRRHLPLAGVTRRIVIRRGRLRQDLLFRSNARFLRIRLRTTISRRCTCHTIQASGDNASDYQGTRTRDARTAKDGGTAFLTMFRVANKRRLVLTSVDRRCHLIVNDLARDARRLART